MNINEKLIGTVSPTVPICVPDFYSGEAEEYSEFEVDAAPDWYSDGIPHCIRYDVLLRWYLPVSKNVVAEKIVLAEKLEGAGFLVQSIEDASDDLSQCHEFYLRCWDPIQCDTEAETDEDQS